MGLTQASLMIFPRLVLATVIRLFTSAPRTNKNPPILHINTWRAVLLLWQKKLPITRMNGNPVFLAISRIFSVSGKRRYPRVNQIPTIGFLQRQQGVYQLHGLPVWKCYWQQYSIYLFTQRGTENTHSNLTIGCFLLIFLSLMFPYTILKRW